MVNKIIMSGRVGKFVQTGATSTGKEMLRFQISIQEKDFKTGEKSYWYINCLMVGGLVPYIKNECVEGATAVVAGSLSHSEYQLKSTFTIMCDTAEFFPAKVVRQPPQQQPQNPEQNNPWRNDNPSNKYNNNTNANVEKLNQAFGGGVQEWNDNDVPF